MNHHESISPVRVGDRQLGPGHPCFIAAEASLNHDGDFAKAEALVKAAHAAGADAIKFQNYRTEDFLFDRSEVYTYESQGKKVTESQWDMFKRCEPSPDWWPRLKKLADELGIVFFSTPTGRDGVDELIDIDVQLLKNGSDYLTHIPLIRYMAETRIPVVLSTGMAMADEVDEALAAVTAVGGEAVVLHCTSNYPTPAEHVNLRRMVAMQSRFSVPIGFSDHTRGHMAAVQAVTLGAVMIEKHVTLERGMAGPDHQFSSDPDELRVLVEAVREAETRLGAAELEPAASETAERHGYRLGAVAAVQMAAGDSLSDENVRFCRPGIGFAPVEWEKYIGAKLRESVTPGMPLTTDKLDVPNGG